MRNVIYPDAWSLKFSMVLSEKSGLALFFLIFLAAISEKSVVLLLLLSWYFRLPTSFWHFRQYSAYRRPYKFLLATTSNLFSLPTYFRQLRLPMFIWDFRLPTSFRGPSDVYLKKVWKISILVYNMSEFESIWRNRFEISTYRRPCEISTYRRPSENFPTFF